MNRFKRTLTVLLALSLCISLMTGFAVPNAAATDWTERTVQEQIVLNTALAYFYKGGAVQYGSYYIGTGSRYKSGVIRTTNNRSPEDATLDDVHYTVCSAFPHDVYYEAFGEHIITEEMAPPSSALTNAVNIDIDSVDSDFLTAVLNTTANYTYHGGMAKAAGFDVSSIDVSSRTNTAAADNMFADVLYYFGPDLDASTGAFITYADRNAGCSGGNLYTIANNVATLAKSTGAESYSSTAVKSGVTVTIGEETVTKNFYKVTDSGKTYYITDDTYTFDENNTLDDLSRADVERIFAEELQPGDIVVTLFRAEDMGDGVDGGHAMMYLGDVDGDGVGEIAHSWGSKYNNSGAVMTAGDSSTAGYKKNITQKVYDKASVTDGDVDYYTSYTAYNDTAYVTGYDLREAAASWSLNNTDGKNGSGSSNSSIIGPDYGGSITIEDWVTRLGPYEGFASAENKVNTAGTYGVDYFNYNTTQAKTSGYYPGNDRREIQPSAKIAFQFTVLRPLNSSRFSAGSWRSGSNTTKGRYNMGDLSVMKTASLNEKQTVAPGSEITYTIKLWNPETTLGLGGIRSGSYSVNVTEAIPANTQLVEGSLSCSSGVAGVLDSAAGTVTWTAVTVPEGGTVTVSYTVQVSNSAALGQKITSPEGIVFLYGASASYLNTKEYTHIVGGAKLTQDQKNTLLDMTLDHAITGTGSGTDIANDIYSALGCDLDLPDTAGILADMVTVDNWSGKESRAAYKYKLKLAGSSELSDMIVPGYIGGSLFMSYDESGIKANDNRLRDFEDDFLEPGDILIYTDVTTSAGAITLNSDEVYVYLGKTDAYHAYYAHYDENGKYEVVNAPLKDVQLSTTSTRFKYSPVLTKAFLYDFFVLLRPTMVASSLASYTSPVTSGASIAAGTAKIGQTVYDSLTAALSAAAQGDTVTLLSDVDLANEAGNNSNKAYPFGIHDDLVLDFNGHTISDSGSTSDGTAIKAPIRVYGGTVELKNGAIQTAGTIAAVSSGNACDLTLTDMNLVNTVCRAIYRSAGSSGDMILSGGYYEGIGNTIYFDTGSSETEKAYLYLQNGVTVHSKSAACVVKMSTNAAAVITDSALTTAAAGGSSLYQGDVTVSGVSYLAAPTRSEFAYGCRYLPAGTKAVIGSTGYNSLSEALAASKAGDTVTLVSDIQTKNEPSNNISSSDIAKYPLRIDCDLTLDFNGHTIDDTGDTVHVPSGASHLAAPMRIYSGTVTLKNGTITSAGTLAALSIGASANVTLTNMTMTNGTELAIYVSEGNSGTVNISGGYYYGGDGTVFVHTGTKIVTVKDGAVLHSNTAKTLRMGEGTTAHLRDAVLATNAASYTAQSLFSGTVTVSSGYKWSHGNTNCTVGGVSCGYADFYTTE